LLLVLIGCPLGAHEVDGAKLGKFYGINDTFGSCDFITIEGTKETLLLMPTGCPRLGTNDVDGAKLGKSDGIKDMVSSGDSIAFEGAEGALLLIRVIRLGVEDGLRLLLGVKESNGANIMLGDSLNGCIGSADGLEDKVGVVPLCISVGSIDSI
jgi:hypothetical protein